MNDKMENKKDSTRILYSSTIFFEDFITLPPPSGPEKNQWSQELHGFEKNTIPRKKSRVRSLVVVTICVDAVSLAMNENEFYEWMNEKSSVYDH